MGSFKELPSEARLAPPDGNESQLKKTFHCTHVNLSIYVRF